MEIRLTTDQTGKGYFFVDSAGDRLAEMTVRVTNEEIIVYHTEVSKGLQGQRLGPGLLEGMVAYARAHRLKVIALCPFVFNYFQRHENEFADVWKKIGRTNQ